jgi:hypothetical protein
MSGITYSGDRAEVAEVSIATATVGYSTSAVEVKVGATRNPARQHVVIYNDTKTTAYLGSSSVAVSGANKGIPIFYQQTCVYDIGDIGLFIIASGTGNIIVQELT